MGRASASHNASYVVRYPPLQGPDSPDPKPLEMLDANRPGGGSLGGGGVSKQKLFSYGNARAPEAELAFVATQRGSSSHYR
jgi:hypothetical protein